MFRQIHFHNPHSILHTVNVCGVDCYGFLKYRHLGNFFIHLNQLMRYFFKFNLAGKKGLQVTQNEKTYDGSYFEERV